MRSCLAKSLLLLLLPVALAAAEGKPIVLLFPVKAGEGTVVSTESEATQAIKSYLRQTGKVDVADFDPESPVIGRAVEENRIEATDLSGASTPDARLRIARLVGMDFVASGDVWVKDDKVNVSLWLGNARTSKIWRNAAAVDISPSGDRDRAASNALQSAASTVVVQLASEALRDVKAEAPVVPGDNIGTTTKKTVEPELVPPPDDAGTYLGRAEQFAKAGDDANAILEYRRAVNADPKNIQIRLKLAKLYVKRKMYPQAVDELERAQSIDPANETVRDELARVYEEKGAPEMAALVYTRQADRNPKDIAARMAAGDSYLRQNNQKEAEKQYRLAAQSDPGSPTPHERLAVLMASQSRWEEGLKELEQFQKLDPKPEAKALADRYTRLVKSVEHDLKLVLATYEAGLEAFSERSITREAYYDIVKGFRPQIDLISSFLAVMTPPESASSAHRHLVLGCSLLAQASGRTASYLETNKTAEKDEAAILFAQARKHITAGVGK